MAVQDLETIIANMRNTSIDPADLDLNQRMHFAIQAYNQESKDSNLRLLHDCIKAINTLNLPREEEKLNRIARILFATEDWGQDVDFSNRLESAPERVGDYGWPPEWLGQVLELPQVQIDCFKPRYSKEFSAMFVEEMVKVVFAGRGEERVVPRELIAFFSCASGVCSLDLDRRGVCPFEAPVKEGASRKEVRDTLVCNNECPSGVVQDLKDVSVDLFGEDVLSRLDVLGGFGFGWNTGVWQSQPVEQWHSYYLFCRHKPGGDEDDDGYADNTDEDKDNANKAEWGWRVVIHLESDGDEGIVQPTKVFDTIFEFLEWYGDWYNRLDLEEFLKYLVEDNEFGE